MHIIFFKYRISLNSVKGKVVPVLKYHSIKVYMGVEVELRAFLISALHEGEWSVRRYGPFTPVIQLPGPIRQEFGWSAKTGLDVVVKTKISCPARCQTLVVRQWPVTLFNGLSLHIVTFLN
jgi:hypothetical protein